MELKQVVKSGFQSFGLDVVRHVPDISRPFDVLTLVVDEHLRRHGRLSFVQVGANDGAMDDPIRQLVIRHGLHGLLIEPLPDMFARLQANYAGHDGLVFENVAINSQPGKVFIHRVAAHASVPEHWHGMASFSREQLIRQGVPPTMLEACEVEAVTMAALLDKHAVKDIGLLQVDVEGYDYEIVKSVLDCGLRPAIVNYEHCHLTPETRVTCKRRLDELGYRFIEVGKDTLAVLQPTG